MTGEELKLFKDDLDFIERMKTIRSLGEWDAVDDFDIAERAFAQGRWEAAVRAAIATSDPRLHDVKET